MTELFHPKSMVSETVLDRLLPMHLQIAPDGRVEHVGPTLRKILGKDPAGCQLFDLLSVRRPAGVKTMADLVPLESVRLAITLSHAPSMVLRAAFANVPGGKGAILDISLGLSFAAAVAEYDLNIQDFSPNDQTLELLYLHEANTSTLRLSRSLTEKLQAMHAAAEYQARTDALTGLPNRRSMDRDLDRLLTDMDEEISILHVDLDLFKEVNDTLGHAAGDAVLVEVGRILNNEIRRNDKPARMGGDEFLILLRNMGDLEVAGRIAARLIQKIEQPIFYDGTKCEISASIGIASTTQYAERPTPSDMLADVDAALYAAKHAGRGRFKVHGVEIEEKRAP